MSATLITIVSYEVQ